MGIEDWIDKITKLWEFDNGRGGTVKSYRVYERNEFPSAVTEFPCAITYGKGVKCYYSVGGVNFDMHRGNTDFYLVPGLDWGKVPFAELFKARIRNAAASSIQLGGSVASFLLDPEVENNIEGPITLAWGGDEPHIGMRVYWVVKENTSGQFVVSA